MYKDTKQIHHLLYEDSVHLFTEVGKETLAEQVDTVYALKKTEELLDDIRKELSKVRKKIELRACLAFFQEAIDNLKTTFCNAKVTMKQFANFPHKRRNDPKKFDLLMDYLGVPVEVRNIEAVRLNWEGFAEYFSRKQAAGEPLPEGITVDDTYTEYTLATRKLKDVDED